MASLVYQILTDPAPLEVSPSQGENIGTIRIVVSNTSEQNVILDSIEITVPVGTGSGDLTDTPAAVTTRIEENQAVQPLFPGTPAPQEDLATWWNDATGVLTVARPNLRAHFDAGGYLVVVLDDFPVSQQAGTVLIRAREFLRTPGNNSEPTKYATLGVPKLAPKVPRNFRPQETLLKAGDDVVLLWDGPATLQYRVQLPDGTSEPATQHTGTSWQWTPSQLKPIQATTYTLIAADPNGRQPLYFLTTSVQHETPTFNGVHTPWVEGSQNTGRITFEQQGAEINTGPNGQGDGKLTAHELHILKDSALDGAVTVGKTLTVIGAVTANDNLHVAKDASLDGAVVVGRTLSIGGTVSASEDLHVTRSASVGGDLSIGGKLTLGELAVARDATVGGALSVTGPVNAGGQLNALGRAVFKDGLHVDGESLFAGKVDANALLSVRNGDHAVMHVVDEKVEIAGDLRVHGAFRSDS
ncbi:hypothetical protein ACFXAZ_07350 [Streptomyces sp. NPDC059477]|uniref:hypothetical protein n=1 Tax=Streptomyces sp. NPDC059477 TaxID=3346847 RepID=UPI0036736710